MPVINVTVNVSQKHVKDILWLMYDRFEFTQSEDPTQNTLRRLYDFGMLDEKIIVFDAGLAHCYFIAKTEGEAGEATLNALLEEARRA